MKKPRRADLKIVEGTTFKSVNALLTSLRNYKAFLADVQF